MREIVCRVCTYYTRDADLALHAPCVRAAGFHLCVCVCVLVCGGARTDDTNVRSCGSVCNKPTLHTNLLERDLAPAPPISIKVLPIKVPRSIHLAIHILKSQCPSIFPI